MESIRNRERQNSESPGRSKTNQREYRLQITKLTQGMPQGQFLAYSVVSKQSAMGLMVHQRLLVLDTSRKQLSYHSTVPQLPLLHPRQLGTSKQTVNLKQANKFQFAVQRIRIGHVNVRWTEKNQKKSWKLIMGSNSLAQKFAQLIQQTINKKDRVIQVEQIIKKGRGDDRRESQMNRKNRRQQLESFQSLTTSEPILHLNRPKDNIKPESNPFDTTINQVTEEESQKLVKNHPNVVLNQLPEQFKTQSSPKLTSLTNPLQIFNPFPPPKTPQPSSTLIPQWLHAKNSHQRAVLYLSFVERCEKSIKTCMQNFFTNHLRHQQSNGKYFFFDNEIQLTYIPLLDSLDNQNLVTELVQKIRMQENQLQIWQSLNYVGSIGQIGDVRILVPLSCIINYGSFKFFCKTTINQFSAKTFITDWQHYKQFNKQLQKSLHVKIINGKQKGYFIELSPNTPAIYFDQLSFLPQISPKEPITVEYLRNYITKGTISSAKDIKAISEHVDKILLVQVVKLIHGQQVVTCGELQKVVKEVGLSHQYLAGLITKGVSKKYNFVQRLVISQMVALGVSWLIRRKMQLMLLKRKDMGHVLYEVKLCLNSLLQQQNTFITTLSSLLQTYFSQGINLSSQPLDSSILIHNTLLSILDKLSINCKVFAPQVQSKDWIWSQTNILNNIELSLMLKRLNIYDRSFCRFQPDFLQKHLLLENTGQINRQTTLFSVIKYLGIQKDKFGRHEISAEYQLLGSTSMLQVDYFLSHYIVPSKQLQPDKVLQSSIYHKHNQCHYFTHSFQFLTVLNRIRWLIKEGHQHQAYLLITEITNRALVWNQLSVLIQIYGFCSQYKFKIGDIPAAVTYSEKALKSAFEYYQNQKTVLVALLIAQHAFQAANMYLSLSQYSKSMELYGHAEKILKRLSAQGEQFILNPQFTLLFSRKCSIYLLFGQYQNCLDSCLEGLNYCAKVKDLVGITMDIYEFRIYEILFRCYQIQKMRREMIEVADICERKYVVDRVIWGEEVQWEIMSSVVKLVWIGIIKMVEIVTPEGQQDSQGGVRLIYLKKVRRELQELRNKEKETREDKFERKNVLEYFRQRIIKSQGSLKQNRLKKLIIQCLSFVSIHVDPTPVYHLLAPSNLSNEWGLFEALTSLIGLGFSLATIQSSLHLYHQQN